MADSQLELGAGVGFDIRTSSALTRVLVLDSENNPYVADLSNLVLLSSRPSGLRSFVEETEGGGNGHGATYWTLPPALSVTADASEGANGRAQPSAGYRWYLTTDLVDQPALDLSLNGSSSTSTDLSSALATRDGEFFSAGAFLAPYDSLYGTLSGASLSFAPIEDATLSIAGFLPSDEDEDAQASVQKAELSYKAVADIEMRVGYGWMHEDGAMLGGHAYGAFGREMASSSEFATASILAPLSEKLSLFGAYTYGTSNAQASSGLISDWSRTRSNAFGVGLLSGDLVTEGDHLSLMIGQPLRVSQGRATLKVPVALDGNRRVVTETQSVDLSPDGREVAIESVYRFALGQENGQVETGAFLRLQPDHDPNAKPDIGVGLRYRKEF